MISCTRQYPLLPRKARAVAAEEQLKIAEYRQQCCAALYKPCAKNQRFAHVIKACQKLSRTDICKLGIPNRRTR